MRSVLVALLLVTSLAGCVTPPLPPLGPERTTSALDPDEQALWKESRELQYKIEVGGLLFDDAEVDAYLARVLERVTPPVLRQASVTPRVEVVSNVNIHGYSFANGVIYIHTALLAHMEDENQLATLLSRELAHVVGRNALRAKREARQRADQMAWITVGSSLVEGGGNAKLLMQAAAMTTAVGFDHSIETIADKRGFEFLEDGGYAVAPAPGLYEMSLVYLGEVHAQGVWGWAPFTPPPQVVARVNGMKALIAASYANQRADRAPILDAAEFRRKIHPVTIRQAELERAAGLFLSAEATARLATESNPRDPQGWVLLAKALTGQRSKPIPKRTVPSIKDVRAALEGALRADGRNADATRELAMTYYRNGSSRRTAEDRDQALKLFRSYLRLVPRAGDREYVAGYIEQLEGEAR